MPKTFSVGDIVRVANPAASAEPDRDFIAKVVRDRGAPYSYPWVLDPEPQTYNGFVDAELKLLGNKERRAYAAGLRDGADRD